MSTLPQAPYIYATQAEAEAASNALYLVQNPDGTTELLYGWFINAQGMYQLAAPSDNDGATVAPPSPPVPPAPTAEALAAGIDNLVASIYSTWTRFQAEYDARLAAAQAFQTAGYVGDPGQWVSAYAAAASVSNQAAADTIIAQGANLTAALATLGALRMQKYTILNAPDPATALTYYNTLTAQIEAAAAQIA